MLPPKPPSKERDWYPGKETWPQWHEYFREQGVFSHPNGKDFFNYYLGGSWTSPQKGTPLIVFFHGAGHTALSFAVLSKRIDNIYITAAYDMRHHGLTKCEDEEDLSIERLTEDALFVISAIKAKIRTELLLILCGHSLGGSIATHVAARLEASQQNVFAVVMLDIVEGLVLEAMSNVHAFVQRYPPKFRSLDEAVTWSLRSILKNPESGCLSIPSQLRWHDEEQVWRWRLDLASTKPFWKDWFIGLTDMFLSLKAAKLLVLAGTPHDKLDNKLTIAHMQGKFQLESLIKTGHVIQVRFVVTLPVAN